MTTVIYNCIIILINERFLFPLKQLHASCFNDCLTTQKKLFSIRTPEGSKCLLKYIRLSVFHFQKSEEMKKYYPIFRRKLPVR